MHIHANFSYYTALLSANNCFPALNTDMKNSEREKAALKYNLFMRDETETGSITDLLRVWPIILIQRTGCSRKK